MEASWDSSAWGRFLSAELQAPVEVSFGRARRQVLVARPRNEGYVVRMHAGFAQAPPDVRQATAKWLSSGRRAKRATRTLDAWIDEVLVPSFVEQPATHDPRQARGEHHDLGRYAAELVPAHFPELAERMPALAWGRRWRTGARRSLHLGTYDVTAHRVRIHRVLDQRAVPEFFVRYVVFHELLHAAHPPRRVGRRVEHHGSEFRRLERAYPDFERAKRWETEHIERLLRSTRTGRPMRGTPREWVQRLLF